jgi:cardiolipin synthase (CMP-forming)
MGLANWLTILRILLIPVFVLLLIDGRPGWALGVFLLAGVTDSLDGYVARRHGMQSRLGAFLDPMADKLLLTASFVTLTWLGLLPLWITVVVLSRDLLLIGGALLLHVLGVRLAPDPTWFGKKATFLQIATVVSALVHQWVDVRPALVVAMWGAAILTTVSGLQYVVRGMRVVTAADATEDRESDEHVLPR